MNKSLAQSLILLTLSAGLAPAQSDNALEQWWTGKRGTGEWFDKRPTLEASGINFTSKWTGTYYGIASGGLERRSAFDQSLNFDLKLDLAKLTGRESLDGLTITSGVRHLEVKPSSLYYAQAGLYMAIPDANATSNHGVDFRGAENNGFYFLAETGLTPEIGPDRLPGNM